MYNPYMCLDVLMGGKLPVAKQETPLPLNSLPEYSLRREYE